MEERVEYDLYGYEAKRNTKKAYVGVTYAFLNYLGLIIC